MGRTSRNKRAGLVIPGVVVEVADRAGELAGPVRDRVVDGAAELAERAGELAERAGDLAERAGHRAAPVRDRVFDGAGELAERAGDLRERAVERSGPLRDRVADGAGELRVAAAPVLGEVLERGGAAWGALRGDAVGRTIAVRRWPWALGAAVAGALAGAVVAKLLAKVTPTDAPGAQEPHELRAVVDSPADRTTPVAAAVVPTVTGSTASATASAATPSPSVPLPTREGEEVGGDPVPAPPVAKTTFQM